MILLFNSIKVSLQSFFNNKKLKELLLVLNGENFAYSHAHPSNFENLFL